MGRVWVSTNQAMRQADRRASRHTIVARITSVLGLALAMTGLFFVWNVFSG